MSHARRIGSGGKLPVYHLFMRHTVEERLLTLSSERRRNIAALIRPAAGRSSPEVCISITDCFVLLMISVAQLSWMPVQHYI